MEQSSASELGTPVKIFPTLFQKIQPTFEEKFSYTFQISQPLFETKFSYISLKMRTFL